MDLIVKGNGKLSEFTIDGSGKVLEFVFNGSGKLSEHVIEIGGGGEEVDLTDYYNKQEVDVLINNTTGKFLDLRLSNLESGLEKKEQDEIKGKLGIGDNNGITPTITERVYKGYDIDLQTETEHWNLAMIGVTDFEFINMFDYEYSKVITITLEGDFAFSFPSWLKPLLTNDNYDTMGGTLVAEIVINIKNGGATPSGYYTLQMIDYAL